MKTMKEHSYLLGRFAFGFFFYYRHKLYTLTNIVQKALILDLLRLLILREHYYTCLSKYLA